MRSHPLQSKKRKPITHTRSASSLHVNGFSARLERLGLSHKSLQFGRPVNSARENGRWVSHQGQGASTNWPDEINTIGSFFNRVSTKADKTKSFGRHFRPVLSECKPTAQ
jgi:hypothetical protein